MTDKLNEIFELPPKDAKKSQEDVCDNTFSKKCKKTKKELQKELDKEKEDFVKSIQDLITSKMPIEAPKRKYERKKPSTEKTIDSEYKEKLRRNMELARSKRHLLKKGVSPKDTFEKSVIKTEEPIEKPVEKVIEKPVEKVIEKVVDKVVDKIVEKPHLLEKDTFEKSIVKNKVSPKDTFEKSVIKTKEEPKEKSFDNTFVKSVPDERYSTYQKPLWFKKPSWMK